MSERSHSFYRLLQRHGVSQCLIAALTEQSHSEVSEIIRGQRKVNAYDLLVRIADGLGVQRGLMGLACADGVSTDTAS
jgi:transcriptional regulator with XRE-family HTH domain